MVLKRAIGGQIKECVINFTHSNFVEGHFDCESYSNDIKEITENLKFENQKPI